MDTMKDTTMQPATDAVIEELRMLAEDLYVNGYTRYSSAMSQAADELEQLRANVERMEEMQAALRRHHEMAMCEGCDHSHPLTQLRLSAYQQSKLYADTVSVLEESK